MNSTPGVFVTSDFWLAHDQTLRRLVAEGLTSGQVARELGVSRNTVVGRARRLGLSWALPGRGGPARTTGPRVPELPPTILPPPSRCVYPHGDPREPDFRWWGEEVVEFGHPYCAEHHLLCYQRMLPKIKLGGATGDPRPADPPRASTPGGAEHDAAHAGCRAA